MRIKFFLVGVLLLIPSAVLACSCIATSPAERFTNAQAVFDGEVVRITELTVPTGQDRKMLVTYRVNRAWKGMSATSASVTMPVSSASCGPDMTVGNTYLLYAFADTYGTLTTNVCAGTTLLSSASADIKYLSNLPQQTVTQASGFSDVSTSYPYYDAITELKKQGIVSGYPDGTFRPERAVSRAEIVKILVEATLPFQRDRGEFTYVTTDTKLPFKDLDDRAWYNEPLRLAVRAGLIEGYRDGTFRPAQFVTVAEASKLLIQSLELESPDSGPIWYERYINALGMRRALPLSLKGVDQPITRGELAEMLWRLISHVTTRESFNAAAFMNKICVQSEDSFIAKVDLREVRRQWLSWYNDVRAQRGLKPYISDPYLSRSASIWSKRAAERGTMNHKRDGVTSYYDYNAITKWFSDLGLTFENIHQITFTENIGWGPYRCSADDCTQELLDAMRVTFDSYMAEEGKASDSHFKGIVNPYFHLLGMGVAVQDGKYYVTTHMATRILSSPPPLCAVGG